VRDTAVRFLIVGGVSTLIQYAVLIATVEYWHWNPVVSSSLGYLISSAANYLLNYRFTFRSDNPHHIAATRFAIVAAIGFSINAALMSLLVGTARFPYVIAQVVSTGVALIWNFWVNSKWSFTRPSSPAGDGS
jgi:putative flippase GtrA